MVELMSDLNSFNIEMPIAGNIGQQSSMEDNSWMYVDGHESINYIPKMIVIESKYCTLTGQVEHSIVFMFVEEKSMF